MSSHCNVIVIVIVIVMDTKETSSVSRAFNQLNTTKEDFVKDVPENSLKQIAHAFQFGIDKFYGDMLTLIETMGLPEKQEKAIKTQFKKAYNERYGYTIDRLMDLIFALDEIKDPNGKRSLTYLGGNQNKFITGLSDLPGEE